MIFKGICKEYRNLAFIAPATALLTPPPPDASASEKAKHKAALLIEQYCRPEYKKFNWTHAIVTRTTSFSCFFLIKTSWHVKEVGFAGMTKIQSGRQRGKRSGLE